MHPLHRCIDVNSEIDRGVERQLDRSRAIEGAVGTCPDQIVGDCLRPAARAPEGDRALATLARRPALTLVDTRPFVGSR